MTGRRWQVTVLSLCVLAGVFSVRAEENRLNRSTTAERLKRDVTYLASEECEGRGVLTEGINKAADYIAREFQTHGLKPVAGQKDYFQHFEMNGEVKLGKPNSLVLHGPQGQSIELRFKDDFMVAGLSGSGKLENVPVVFTGYGASADRIGYDDFKDVDVTGKVVVVLRKTPRPENGQTPFDDKMNGYHAALTTKQANAEKHKAAAVLFVNDRDTARSTDILMNFSYASPGSKPAKIPVLHVRRSTVESCCNPRSASPCETSRTTSTSD